MKIPRNWRIAINSCRRRRRTSFVPFDNWLLLLPLNLLWQKLYYARSFRRLLLSFLVFTCTKLSFRDFLAVFGGSLSAFLTLPWKGIIRSLGIFNILPISWQFQVSFCNWEYYIDSDEAAVGNFMKKNVETLTGHSESPFTSLTRNLGDFDF